MRYYQLAFRSNEDEIREKAIINVREYDYDSAIGAVNKYIYKNRKSTLSFLIYKEENDVIQAVFSYDEKRDTFEDALGSVLKMLSRVFSIRKSANEPAEITMYQFFDYYLEGKRRGYVSGLRDIANDRRSEWFFDGYNCYDPDKSCYDFAERIAQNVPAVRHEIYDKSFLAELANIEEHANISGNVQNMVHYVIAAGSAEAARDMTDALMQNLLLAGRVKSRRIESVSSIHPDLYEKNNHLADIIENNYGGAIVIDLTEHFGNSPTEYVMTSRYLENLFKQYRNECLFIFTYNIDHPGFSYQILPNLNKYAIPVLLREGRGNRRTAIRYMKYLIGKSEYSEYSGQAAAFLKRYPGDSFTQTDVLTAYEQFEPWCVNRNILQAYDYDPTGDFALERDASGKSSYEKLQELIGLDLVKKQIDAIIAAEIIERERRKKKALDHQALPMHMVYAGSPGTAKSTVARLFAGIAKERGILRSGAFVESSGPDLDGHVGKIRGAFLAAKGGVLFIDEAYALSMPDSVTTLIQEMENRRDEVIVVLAGYNEDMRSFMKRNDGLESRVPHWVEFPDYSVDELTEIFRLMLSERGFTATEEAVREARYIFEKAKCSENFGNGRFVRNLIGQAAQKQALRLLSGDRQADTIRSKELFLLTKDDICMLNEDLAKKRPEGTALCELEEMVGLASVKAVIHKAVAHYKMHRYCLDRGIPRDNASMHMVFTGNPGTAKTTVARLFAEILCDEKVLPTGKLVEVGRSDLVGAFQGTTPIIVKNKFKEAKGGVLFIDEAYALCDGHKGGYGDEAINTIVQEMENHRNDVIVIFAGYPEPMEEFLARNPGMRSRIAFHVRFEDYSVDELCAITKLMADRKGLTITEIAMEEIRQRFEKVCGSGDFGNGRFVRKMLEEAEMNLAERVFGAGKSVEKPEIITTIEACDIPDIPVKAAREEHRIGFAS